MNSEAKKSVVQANKLAETKRTDNRLHAYFMQQKATSLQSGSGELYNDPYCDKAKTLSTQIDI